MKKNILSIILFYIISFSVTSQNELSSFTNTGHGGATTFAGDYQCTGINPANLGWAWKYDKRKFTIGTNEFTGSLHSEALQKKELRDMLRQVVSGNIKDFTSEQKREAARAFIDKGFSVNADYGIFGFAFTTKKIGGFAFRVSDRFQWYSKFGETASDILFNGKNAAYFDSLQYLNPTTGITQIIPNHQNMSADSLKNVLMGLANAPKMIGTLFNNSEIKMTWTREYNLSYGRKIFGDSLFALFGGIGLKYVQGTGYLDIHSENNVLTATSSLSPSFNVSYGNAVTTAKTITGSGFPPKSVGNGYGFDFGLNCIIKNKLKFGASLINIGSLTWTGNVYSIKDTILTNTFSAGMNNYNIPGNLKDIMGQNGFMKLIGTKEIKTQLPGMFRFGGSLMIKKLAEIGFDIILPMNTVAGNFNKPVIGFGGDIMPIRWIKLQAGFVVGGNYDFSIPLGIIFITKGGRYEAGIASRDAVTFFTQNGPTISFSTGFMRFRF